MTPEEYIEKAEKIALEMEKNIDSLMENTLLLEEVDKNIDAEDQLIRNKVRKLEEQSEILERVIEKVEDLMS